jgi:predicted dehydrogenase
MGDVRVALIGAGGMGFNHARVLATTKGVRFVGVLDPDSERASAVAETFGCRVLEDLDEVVAAADAASIVVPSAMHAEIALSLLRAGLHCLIEKPFVTREADGLAVIEAAASTGARVLVGHIERFNPAVQQLHEILRAEHRVAAFDARRMSAVSGRVTDVDVVTDLMVHDLDIVMDLVGEPIVDLVARAPRGTARSGDYVAVLATFATGALAAFTASRITQNQVRELQVTTDSRFLSVDYPNQELLIYRQGRIGNLHGRDDASRYVLDVATERVFVRRVEPLVAEVAHFVDVCRGVAEPRVTAEHSLDVMRVVWKIHGRLEAEADHG